MGIKKRQELPRRLVGVQQRLERWRLTRKVRERIPDKLWDAAVGMANVYGVNRTAKALRLDYYELKKRVKQCTAVAGDAQGSARFVELAPVSSAGCCECLLELEDIGGAKMRMQLKGIAMPDLASLTRAFLLPAKIHMAGNGFEDGRP